MKDMLERGDEDMKRWFTFTLTETIEISLPFLEPLLFRNLPLNKTNAHVTLLVRMGLYVGRTCSLRSFVVIGFQVIRSTSIHSSLFIATCAFRA